MIRFDDRTWGLLEELEAAREALDRWRGVYLEMALRLRRGQRSGLVTRQGHDESHCRLGCCLAQLSALHPGDPYLAELSELHADFHAYADATCRMIAAGEAEAAITALTGTEFEARRGALTDRITELIAWAA
ncbi:hypothetical protein [Oceanicola sp. S124]|uniref:hypothetical protein n=1 Tax=Oceanicola sp. S124 TaxID=1042378 RepID=UPI0002557E39|nr:hypothetical protein [Oceanicola sp. S124]